MIIGSSYVNGDDDDVDNNVQEGKDVSTDTNDDCYKSSGNVCNCTIVSELTLSLIHDSSS